MPTVYRAERSGPVFRTYLDRMVRVFGVPMDQLLSAQDGSDRILSGDVMTGSWIGMCLATESRGRPFVLIEDVHLVERGTQVEGHPSHRGCDRDTCDTFVDCTIKENIFSGRIMTVDWTFPLDAPAFVLSGTQDMTWLRGYLTWFDMASEQP